eukprot:SAG31_NODE_16381_length_711_cov_1.166667_1_plen_170_part_10
MPSLSSLTPISSFLRAVFRPRCAALLALMSLQVLWGFCLLIAVFLFFVLSIYAVLVSEHMPYTGALLVPFAGSLVASSRKNVPCEYACRKLPSGCGEGRRLLLLFGPTDDPSDSDCRCVITTSPVHRPAVGLSCPRLKKRMLCDRRPRSFDCSDQQLDSVQILPSQLATP